MPIHKLASVIASSLFVMTLCGGARLIMLGYSHEVLGVPAPALGATLLGLLPLLIWVAIDCWRNHEFPATVRRWRDEWEERRKYGASYYRR